jgi:N-acetylmuramoyl-L-alanine amidase
MVVAAIPISGAVSDQNIDTNGGNSFSGLTVGITGAEVQEAQSVIENNKPFGENSSKILGNNTTTNGSLKIGATGDKVKEIQQWLTNYGYYSGDIDGVFGNDTETAVKNFQEESGLIVDGVVGNDTKNAMANWDKYLTQVQAAAGESTSDTSYSSSSSKKTYATAVRSYSKSYSSSGYSGDCWDVSNAMYNQLTSSGTRARIVQYANSYSSNHRSVEVWDGSSWVDADYSGQAWVGQPTTHDSSATVIAGG